MTAEDGATSLTDETVDDYMDVLERTFILEKIGPWSPNVRSPPPINKKPKYHYADPSLAAAILGSPAGGSDRENSEPSENALGPRPPG